jgi:hypothetical protein
MKTAMVLKIGQGKDPIQMAVFFSFHSEQYTDTKGEGKSGPMQQTPQY